MKKRGLILFAALLFCAGWTKAAYHVALQIGKDQIGHVNQLAIGADDTLCVLENNGKVTLFNPDGSLISVLETGMANTGAIATDAQGNIHVFSTLTKTKKVKMGARMRKVQIPVGVQCGVFDPSGKKIKTIEYKNLKSAKAARLIGDKLVVADLTDRSLVIMDAETGKETGRIKKGLRLCCGIFDFCEAPNHTIAVSNLGAFKLQQFDLEGKLLLDFGKRGREINDFHGCCNPVSAAYLPDGKILTVEKDPTRIKIYDATGKNAQKIEGIEELVKGCEFIPVATDSKGNIYLAANRSKKPSHIVKCEP
jgi:hypothetical protein